MSRLAGCLATTVGLLVLSSPVHAEGEDREMTGCYAGVSETYLLRVDKNRKYDADDTSKAHGAKLSLGCRSHGGLGLGAAELSLESAFDFQGSTDVHVLTADLKAYWLRAIETMIRGNTDETWLSKWISPYIAVGFGYAEYAVSGENPWDFVTRWGGGTDIRLWKHMKLRIESTYVEPTKVRSRELDNHLSVGGALFFTF